MGENVGKEIENLEPKLASTFWISSYVSNYMVSLPNHPFTMKINNISYYDIICIKKNISCSTAPTSGGYSNKISCTNFYGMKQHTPLRLRLSQPLQHFHLHQKHGSPPVPNEKRHDENPGESAANLSVPKEL